MTDGKGKRPFRKLDDSELEQLFTHVPRFGRTFWHGPPAPPEELPDMSRTHMKTLVFLRLHGPSPLSTVARWVNLEKGSFTPVARRLAEAGLVETVADETDRRRTLLRLSPRGEALEQAMRDRMTETFHSRLSTLSADEQAEFFATLSRLNALLDRMAPGDGGKPPCPIPPFHAPARAAQEGSSRCSD